MSSLIGCSSVTHINSYKVDSIFGFRLSLPSGPVPTYYVLFADIWPQIGFTKKMFKMF